MLIDGRPVALSSGEIVRPIELLLDIQDVLDSPGHLSSVNIVNIVRARAMQLREADTDPTIAAEAAALADELTPYHIRNIGQVSAFLSRPIHDAEETE